MLLTLIAFIGGALITTVCYAARLAVQRPKRNQRKHSLTYNRSLLR